MAYPEMHNPTSSLRQEANKILNEMGAAAADNPQAILHAAEAAGQRLGLKPQAPRYQNFGRPVGGSTGPAPEASSSETAPISDEAAAKIAKSLAMAMPKGKFTDEQMVRIKENSAKYREHKHLFIRQ